MRDVLFQRNSDCPDCVSLFEGAGQGIAGDAGDLRRASRLCYKRDMRELREWISEKMRRRPRRGPNDSESTGKSGQELPSNQPAPLRPSYPEAAPGRAAAPTPVEAEHLVEPAADGAVATPLAEDTAPAEPKIV